MSYRGAYDPHGSAAIVAHRRRWVAPTTWVPVSIPDDVIPEWVLAQFDEDWPPLTD